MNQEEVLQRLAAAGGYYQNDHVVLTSGRHSDVYANFRVLFALDRKEELELFCCALADRFHGNPAIEFVVGPKKGGAIIAERLAVLLSGVHRPFVRPIVAFKREGDEKDFSFYDDDARFLKGKSGLFVDDVLSTGSSVRPVQTRVNELGGRIVAMGYMLNRSGLGAVDFDVASLESLAEISARSVTAEECASDWLCGHGRPINTKVGHGAKFMAEHRELFLRKLHDELGRKDLYSLEMGRWDPDAVLRMIESRRTIVTEAFRLAEEAVRAGHNRDTIVADVLRHLGIDAEAPRF